MMERNNITVLCIDDSEVDRQCYKRYLQQDKSCSMTFIEVSSAEEGMQKIGLMNPDCILIDYYLPDQDGLTFIQSLVTKYPEHAPVIMMTGQGNELVAAEAIKYGVADYIIKSKITASGLVRAIQHSIEKHQLQGKIRLQNIQLTHMNSELERTNQNILLAYQNLSHELKTPLTAMKEFLHLLIDEIVGPVNQEQTEVIAHAIENCDLMKLYIQDLLESSALDSGKIKLHLSSCSLEHIFNFVLTEIASQTKAKNIHVQANIEKDLPFLLADQRRIIQILLIIINNAIKFSSENSAITINATRNTDPLNTIQISITDQGAGIAAQDIGRIFDRFYQAKSKETDPIVGLGLGLNIAHNLATLHQGKITVDSELGKGSTFSVILPIIKSQE